MGHLPPGLRLTSPQAALWQRSPPVSGCPPRDHDGTTALHSAALGGQLESLRVLLAHGAGLGAASNVGETALHFAAREGFLDATRLLVSSGAVTREAGPIPPTAPARRASHEY